MRGAGVNGACCGNAAVTIKIVQTFAGATCARNAGRTRTPLHVRYPSPITKASLLVGVKRSENCFSRIRRVFDVYDSSLRNGPGGSGSAPGDSRANESDRQRSGRHPRVEPDWKSMAV